MLSSKFIRNLALLGGLVVSGPALAGSPEAIEAEFKGMDINGDGRLSADEHAAGARRMFDGADTNKDGRITAAELTAAHEAMMGKKAGAPGTSMAATAKIKELDANGDGQLTLAEHTAGAKLMFERMDTDKDGLLSRAELIAGHKAMLPK